MFTCATVQLSSWLVGQGGGGAACKTAKCRAAGGEGSRSGRSVGCDLSTAALRCAALRCLPALAALLPALGAKLSHVTTRQSVILSKRRDGAEARHAPSPSINHLELPLSTLRTALR